MITDGPVGGLSYQTATRSGVTNGSGEFEYLPGETVQFSVGGIEFPPVAAGERVTPLDMAGTDADLDDPVVVNILRLLQTLDADGDPDNGITIAPAVAESLENVNLDFSAPGFETTAATAVNNAVGRPLVAAEQAVAHFERSLQGDLLGSWVYAESNGNINVLTFIDDSTYLIAHSQDDDDEQIAGSVEYGRYSWNPVTGAFAVTEIIRESDGSGGLSDMQDGGAKLIRGETRLTFTVDGESFSFNAVPASDAALTGAWTLYEAESANLNVLTFYTATDYVVAHTNNQASYSGQPAVAASSEWGSYTWSIRLRAVHPRRQPLRHHRLRRQGRQRRRGRPGSGHLQPESRQRRSDRDPQLPQRKRAG